MKRNNLRKIYMFYSIALAEIYVLVIAFCAGYILSGELLRYVWYGAVIVFAIIPVIMYLIYRWRRKDNADSSDELEQFVLSKAFAAAGFIAITLLPALLMFVCVFNDLAELIVLVYSVIVGGTLKLSTLYYYRKY